MFPIYDWLVVHAQEKSSNWNASLRSTVSGRGLLEYRRERVANALAEQNNHRCVHYYVAGMELSEILYNKAEYIETVCECFMILL